MQHPKIALVTTGGGLISMSTLQGAIPVSADKNAVAKAVPELQKFCTLSVLECFQKDSENLHPQDWQFLAGKIYRHLGKYDAFVITHGTDTLAYTAAALSFFFMGCPKPIILVAGTQSIFSEEKWGKKEIINACKAACACTSGVYVVSNGNIYLGTRVKKQEDLLGIHYGSSLNALVGQVGRSVSLVDQKEKRKMNFVYNQVINEDIAVFLLYPGIKPSAVLHQIIMDKPKAVIFVSYGTGCFPIEGTSSMKVVITECKERQIPLLSVSPSQQPLASVNRFFVGNQILALGVCSLGDMTMETAIVKCMWLLGQSHDKDFIEQEMLRDHCGEITNAE